MMQNNIKIAITGGIGSGKSTVSEMIRSEGYTVYSCDEIYNELLNGGGLAEEIGVTFGVAVNNGELDKKALADVVFNDKSALEKLNSITHSKIYKAVFDKMNEREISFCEVPLLFESGYEKYFDEVIVVLRNKESRINSLIQRNGLTRSEVEKRIKSQYNYDNANFTEYYVIHNDGNLQDLKLKTINVLQKIKEKYLKNF